jgi:hypothetical protein
MIVSLVLNNKLVEGQRERAAPEAAPQMMPGRFQFSA